MIEPKDVAQQVIQVPYSPQQLQIHQYPNQDQNHKPYQEKNHLRENQCYHIVGLLNWNKISEDIFNFGETDMFREFRSYTFRCQSL